jgi:hypothetical protein
MAMKRAQTTTQAQQPSSRTRSGLVVGGCVLLVAILYAGAVLPDLGDEQAAAALTPDTVVSSQPLVPQRARAAHVLREQPAAPELDEPSAEEPSDEEPPSAPKSLADVARQLEQRFASDGAPSGQMVDVRNKFATIFAQRVVQGAELKDIECRANVCRAEVAFSSPLSDQAFFRHAFLNPETRMDYGLDISVPIREKASDGRTAATVFMFKAPPALAAAEGEDELQVESYPAP